MHRNTARLDDHDSDARQSRKMREALDVLLEARERLLTQMTGEILSHREGLIDPAEDGAFSFELQEIEDRYSARLSALNALLENLEYRQPRVRHRVEMIETRFDRVGAALGDLLDRFEDWDLVTFEVVERPLRRGGSGASADVGTVEVSVDGVSVDGVSVDGVSVDGVSVDGESVDGESVDGESMGGGEDLVTVIVAMVRDEVD